MSIEVIKAKPEDALTLAKVSKKAFDNDITIGSEESGGPPGYDTQAWQLMIMKKSEYYSVFHNGIIIGGAIIFRKGREHLYVGRIFIDPEFHKKGFGIKIMEFIEKLHPETKIITLETPQWNSRTRKFYQKVGYKIVKETKDEIFFEKRIGFE